MAVYLTRSCNYCEELTVTKPDGQSTAGPHRLMCSHKNQCIQLEIDGTMHLTGFEQRIMYVYKKSGSLSKIKKGKARNERKNLRF
jgi:hypothetical protein